MHFIHFIASVTGLALLEACGALQTGSLRYPLRPARPASRNGGRTRCRTAASSKNRSGVATLRCGLQEAEVAYFEPLTREDTPSPGAVTRELPLFPLNLVCCPHGKTPLHIFEMRYRQMMNTVAKGDSRFGIIMSDPTAQKIAAVGTVVEVVERSLLPDGRQLIMNVGRERFRLLRVLQEKPYLLGLVEVGVSDAELPEGGSAAAELAEAEREVWTILQDVVRLSNKVYDKTRVSVSDDVTRFAPGGGGGAPAGMAESERRTSFSFSVTEMMDVPSRIKQVMLQSTDTRERLSFQAELLLKARKYLAAQASLKDTLG